MDFDDSPTEAAFRQEVRDFLESNATRKGSRRGADTVDLAAARTWQFKKSRAGFGAIMLPEEFGGRGGTTIQQVIYDQEEQNFQIPPGRLFMMTFGMCIPTMIAFARPDVLADRVQAAIKGEELWCQLFSEPAAGSDLAGIRTRAEGDGDDWVVNGQKVWTSYAIHSDYGLLLARTDPSVPKHAGLTAFFVDMRSPGIEIRPIRQIDGGSHFNEVFFTDVRIPDSQRLGEVNKGWQVALRTLMNERVAVGHVDGPDFDDVVAVLDGVEMEGAPVLNDPVVRDRLVDWYCNSEGLKYTMFRVLTALSRGEDPGPEASILKVVGAKQLVELSSYVLDLLGPAGAASAGNYFQGLFLRAPGERIGGGTEEVMMNVIAERVLAMPADIRVDKNIAFNQI